LHINVFLGLIGLGRLFSILFAVYLPEHFCVQNIPRGDLVVIGNSLPHPLQMDVPRFFLLLSLSLSLSV
jgi:hypothetical protein